MRESTSSTSRDARVIRHSSPWCDLRSRLGAVKQQPAGTGSTRSIYLGLPLKGSWQVHILQADMWQVYMQ